MATAELPSRSGPDLGGISSLANLFLGKETSTTGSDTTTNTGGTSTSGTRTTTSGVSQAAIDATVRSILEGSQGLANVASGQNRVGLYNSSTNRMLINDLIARASAEGAKLNRSETTSVNEATVDNRTQTRNSTQNQNTKAPISPKAGIGVVGGLSLLSQLGKTDMGKSLIQSITGGFKGLGGGAAAANSGPTEADVRDAMTRDGTSSAVDSATSGSATPSMAANGASTASALGKVGASDLGTGQGVTSNDVDVSSVIDNMETVSPGFDNLDLGVPDMSFDPNTATGDFQGNYGGGDTGGNADLGSGDWAADFGPGDWGVDPGTVDYGDVSYNIDELFSFDEGGYVTRDGNERKLSRITKYASGIANPAAEAAFNSGGDEPERKDNAREEKKESAPAKEDKTGRKSWAVRMFDAINNRGGRTNYATGGMVDLSNLGLRKREGEQGSPLAVTGNAQSAANVTGRRNASEQAQANQPTQNTSRPAPRGTTATNSPNGVTTGRQRQRDLNSRNQEVGSGSASEGGTSAANNASPGVGANSGIGPGGGAVGSAIGSVTGTPGLGSVGGLASASNNNQATASFVSALASIAFTPLVAPLVNSLVANNSQTNSDTMADTANAVSALNSQDSLDTLISMIDAQVNGANSVASVSSGVSADSGGAVGTSSGDAVGTDGDGGVGAGGGDGGSAMARGGSVKGKGSSTSDSIDAKLSDGEYVINAAAVAHYGKDFFDQINESIQPSPAQLRQGDRLRQMQGR